MNRTLARLHQQPQEFPCNFGRRAEQVRNNCYGVGPGLDHRAGIRTSDAPNSNQRFLCRRPRGADALDPDWGLMVPLGRSCKDRTISDVVRGAGISFFQLIEIVRGYAKDTFVADHCARALRRKVILADMRSVVNSGNADVGAIVHDKGHAIAQRTADLARLLQHLARCSNLVSILQDSHASGGELACIVNDRGRRVQRRREAPDVEDGVKLRQQKPLSHTVGSSHASLAGPRKRSMNFVSKLPARKSGSAMMRRCSGMLVKMPSTTNISKARDMREIASARSRPRTTSLAISES